MKWIPMLLLTYCILAVVLSLYLGVAQYKAWKQSGILLAQAKDQLATAQDNADTAKTIWLDLDNEQRANRPEYDGEKAVDIGFRAQLAYEDYQRADQQLKAADQRAGEIEDRTRTAAKNLVPLSIGFLLHLLGIMILWPGRKKRPESPGTGGISRSA